MELSATEARLRALKLHREVLAPSAQLMRRSSAGLFKATYSTDLLFLIDTTGSMGGSIDAAKEQVKSIVNDIKLAFLNEADVRIAVVGYKDHGDSPNIQFLDFTESAEQVRSFLTELTAIGGGDAPEDVLGGLRQALDATWKHQTRCIIHIADAPPHGHTLNDGIGDDYPNPGSEPHGLTHEPLLKRMVSLHINYALLRINGSTDRMAFTFLKVYATASPDCKLHQDNKYYSEANAMTASRGRELTQCNAKAGLFFEELELGTSYSALRHLVVKSVITSASRTAARATMSMAGTRRAGTGRTLDMYLVAIEEDDSDADDVSDVPDVVPLEAVPPHWDTPGWLNETLMVEGFSLDVVVHGPSTLNDMMAHDDNIKMSMMELTIHKRSRPFAQGTLRVASYARTAASTNLFVVKSSKIAGKTLAHLAEDMRCQALCKAFALEFNALSGEAHSIDFIVTTCLKGKAGTISGADECMSLEPFIDGTYVKYNNNCGYVNEYIPDDRFNQAAQAFSHFTFERSRGSFLVSDLQGVGHVLTDPAIHTSDPKRFLLAETNLGPEGFKFFFATHKCNGICTKLGLKSSAAMLMSGSYSFRQIWPSMDLTVCCSNKLCSKIVRLASTKKSDKFPGYSWCDACWPQLRATTVKWICVCPGPHHEFEVSKFFYESQAQ
ncbi:kinase-like domain-containing protein [Mycena leptocephala]|nr:kinase-like domain-containing protein [Mycena leptocephala]